jgi:FG-GAP repeat
VQLQYINPNRLALHKKRGNLYRWFRRIALLGFALVLASCNQPSIPLPTQDDLGAAWFTDEDLDNAVLKVVNPRAVQGLDDGGSGSDVQSPSLDLPESPRGDFEAQAVISNARGFVYYIRKETSSVANLFCGVLPSTATWKVIRQDQRTGGEVQFLCSIREIQSVAGSNDGTTMLISRKDTAANGADFEIFQLTQGTATTNQLTNNTTHDVDVSMSSDASAKVWQGKNPTTNVEAVFFINGTGSFLDVPEPQNQPSISANGQFITMIRHLADGRDRILRFNPSTDIYTTFFTSTADLEHPSITDDGTRVAFLQNGGISDSIQLKTAGVSSVTTLVPSVKFTFLEHPHLTRDGRWLTYASETSDVFNVFTKHLVTGVTSQLSSATGNVDASDPYWQIPVPFSLELKRTEGNALLYGSAVAIEGDVMAVGSRVATVNNQSAVGGVFIYERNGAGPETWTLAQTLTAPTPQSSAGFGNALAIHGSTMIVGEFTRDVNNAQSQGAAYIFQRNASGQWGFVKELVAPDLAASDNFGFSVDVFGDTAVVSALRGDTTKPDSGSIYIFERNQGGTNQWGLVQKRFASDASTDDAFGSSVSIYENAIVVGSPSDDNTRGLNAGSVYFFERNTGGTNAWGQVRKRVALNGQSGEFVGSSVAIEKTVAVAGAPGALNGSGVAYLFKQGTNNAWPETGQVSPEDRPLDADFGYAVALGDRYIVVGAYRDNDSGNDAGSAYVFDLKTPKSGLKLLASDGASLDNFGNAVAVSGDTVVIGAERAGTNDQGKVYLYE